MTHRLGGVALLLTIGACTAEPELELPPLTLHGNYVSMGIEGPAQPCAGTLPWLDRHVESLGALFERSVEGVTVDYYWLSLASVTALCGPAAYACAPPGAVYSASPLIEHELVHAVVDGRVGRGEGFFDEGLAVALGSGLAGPYEVDEFADVLAMIGSDRTLALEYAAAGAFVNDLIEVHGAVAVLNFYDRTTNEDTHAVVADVFEQELGISLEAAHQAFLSRGRGCTMLLAACTMPPTPWTGDVWTVDAPVSCSTDALGPEATPTSESGRPWTFVSFEVGTPGSYVLELDSIPQPLYAAHCGPCGERAASVAFGVPGEAEPVELAAGRWVVSLIGSDDLGHDRVFPLRVRPAG
jgi:hypothetical protein